MTKLEFPKFKQSKNKSYCTCRLLLVNHVPAILGNTRTCDFLFQCLNKYGISFCWVERIGSGAGKCYSVWL